jgi:hypothetical protein
LVANLTDIEEGGNRYSEQLDRWRAHELVGRAPRAEKGNIRAMAKGPLISLNHGTKMPTLGLGVLDRSVRELTAGAVEAASVDGYRLIDTAASYLNER